MKKFKFIAALAIALQLVSVGGFLMGAVAVPAVSLLASFFPMGLAWSEAKEARDY